MTKNTKIPNYLDNKNSWMDVDTVIDYIKTKQIEPYEMFIKRKPDSPTLGTSFEVEDIEKLIGAGVVFDHPIFAKKATTYRFHSEAACMLMLKNGAAKHITDETYHELVMDIMINRGITSPGFDEVLDFVEKVVKEKEQLGPSKNSISTDNIGANDSMVEGKEGVLEKIIRGRGQSTANEDEIDYQRRKIK